MCHLQEPGPQEEDGEDDGERQNQLGNHPALLVAKLAESALLTAKLPRNTPSTTFQSHTALEGSTPIVLNLVWGLGFKV